MNRAEGDLHIGVLIEIIQNDIWRSVALDVNRNAHTLAVGVIVAIADAFQLLFFDQVADGFNQPRFVDLIGQLGHDNLITAIGTFYDFRLGADGSVINRIQVQGLLLQI